MVYKYKIFEVVTLQFMDISILYKYACVYNFMS